MHEWQVGDVRILRIEDLDLVLPSDEHQPRRPQRHRSADPQRTIRGGCRPG